MTDQITYTTDISLLQAEISLKFPDFIDDEGNILGITKTPTIHNGKASLALVRNPAVEFSQLDNLTLLGTYEEVFADPKKKAIYDSVYPPALTYFDQELDKEAVVIPPEKFGVFF